MSSLARSLAFVAALLAVNVTTVAVLSSNLRHGVYSPDADSIGLPIGLTILASLLALAALALVAAGRSGTARFAGRKYLWWAAAATRTAGYAGLALFGLGGAAAWLAPDHYAISLSYAALVAWLVYELRGEASQSTSRGNAV